MTGAEGTTERRAKRIRNIGRALAAIWAASATLSLLTMASFSVFMHWATWPHTSPPLDMWLALALLVLPSWIGAAIPWRSERFGGVVLVVLGFLLLTLAAWMWFHPVEGFLLLIMPLLIIAPPPLLAGSCLLLFAGLPLATGFLLLANWWKSRTLARPEATG